MPVDPDREKVLSGTSRPSRHWNSRSAPCAAWQGGASEQAARRIARPLASSSMTPRRRRSASGRTRSSPGPTSVPATSTTGQARAKAHHLPAEAPKPGKYEVRLAYSAGGNRAGKVPVTVFSADGEKTLHIDQRKQPDVEGLFVSLGQYTFERSSQVFVLIANEGTTGHVIADAVVFIPVEPLARLPRSPRRARRTRGLHRLERRAQAATATGPPPRKNAHGPGRADHRGRPHQRPGQCPQPGGAGRGGFLRGAARSPAGPAGNGQRAAQLGDWLASSDNPLTARVFVNRAWHWLFSAGSGSHHGQLRHHRRTAQPSRTARSPGRPIHRLGWSVKTLVRTIVLSRAYRQASAKPLAAAIAIDPDNRLLALANRRRLDAECIRDTLLAVSGQLVLDRGGPTYRPGLATDYGYRHTDARAASTRPCSATPCRSCSRFSTLPIPACRPECAREHGRAAGAVSDEPPVRSRLFAEGRRANASGRKR